MFEFFGGLAAGLMIAGALALLLQILKRRGEEQETWDYFTRGEAEAETLAGGGMPLATREEVGTATNTSRAVTPIGLLGIDNDAEVMGQPVKALEVALTDWGEDFTGEGDVLPRWRWGVYDYDHLNKVAYSGSSDIGVNVPYMIGNSPTMDEAIEVANAWCCDTYGKGRYNLTVLPATKAADE